MLQVTVCGDGPVAYSIALNCAHRGNRVRVLTAAPERWAPELRGVLPDRQRLVAPLDLATASPEAALAGSDVVLVCVSHAESPQMLARIAPFIGERTLLGGIPGFGGFGIAAAARLAAGTVFGTQRIPFVIRDYWPGQRIRIGGIRRQTFVGTLPAERSEPVAALLGQLLGIATVPVSHYLNIELSPSNSLVNPARLFALLAGGASPDPATEFFTDWDLAASHALLRLDAELQRGRMSMPRDTSFVAPIRLQYDANDAHTLTARFRRLTALAGRPVPITPAGALDLGSPYITEDIDHGLVLLRAMLRLAGAPTPGFDEILAWRHTLGATPTPSYAETVLAQLSDIEALASLLD